MPDQPFVSSAFTRTILSHAQQSGLCREQLLQRAGINLSCHDGQGLPVPAHLVEKLWSECERLGAGATFGCELVNGMATNCLQGLNILLDSATTLRASLVCFTEFLPTCHQLRDGRTGRGARAGPIALARDGPAAAFFRSGCRGVDPGAQHRPTGRTGAGRGVCRGLPHAATGRGAVVTQRRHRRARGAAPVPDDCPWPASTNRCWGPIRSCIKACSGTGKPPPRTPPAATAWTWRGIG